MAKKILIQNKIKETVACLQSKQRILFLTTSNRYEDETKDEMPKSSQLAEEIKNQVGPDKIKIIDVTKLKIYHCEGNVSLARGNICGHASAVLEDKEKNPSGFHRCWNSIHNPDDELWQISRELLNSDCVVIFGCVRWGQMNSYYQKLIERLTWLENRHSCNGEANILKNIEAGIIAVGHNWRGKEIIAAQKQVLGFFGFKVVPKLCWHWQYAKDNEEENNTGYLKDSAEFKKILFGD